MISVTAAANGAYRPYRPMGLHWKGVGSGRVSMETEISSYSKAQKDTKKSCSISKQKHLLSILWNLWRRLFGHLLTLFLTAIDYCFRRFKVDNGTRSCSSRIYAPLYVMHAKELPKKSLIETFDDEILLKIFTWLDACSVVNLERCSSKLKRFVAANVQKLPKYHVDQVKLHFDEGELMIYPTDEKLAPSRFVMPTIQMLALKLKHFSTSSLFIRGLIPIEAIPVLQKLLTLSLQPTQIYFLWCEFSVASRQLLKEYIAANVNYLCDVGFEECQPISIFDDDLIESVVPNLTALRIWNDGRSGRYHISDKTLLCIAGADKLVLETLDVATSQVTISGIGAVVERWSQNPQQDVGIVVHGCKRFSRNDLFEYCRSKGLNMSNQGLLTINHFTLSVFIG
ncbi:unnamed protein product [Anisakis simplex]|uniref:F-box domain-containing protein n=1 Tax=Anisakis simplex TaxID=6269 RepID=A0A0M3JZA9_ANISI|nr:unnamed protein product [Anisakis simplex]